MRQISLCEDAEEHIRRLLEAYELALGDDTLLEAWTKKVEDTVFYAAQRLMTERTHR